VNGWLSAHNLAGILLNNGVVTKDQMNNLFRATFMEELN
jgi:hypothetical protein